MTAVNSDYDVSGEATSCLQSAFRWGGVVHASALRSTVLAVWLVSAIVMPLPSYASFDESLFRGFGVGRLVLAVLPSSALSGPALQSIQICLLLSCLAALLSSRLARPATILALFCAVVSDSIMKGVGGFANHAQTVPLMLLGLAVAVPDKRALPLAVLLTSGRKRLLTFDHRATWSGRVFVWIAALIVVLPYSYVGWYRWTSGGPTFLFGDGILQYFSAASRGFSSYWWTMDLVDLGPALSIGFAVTTVFEALSPLVLVSRQFRLVWLPAMLLFHLSTVPLMNVLFWENIAVVTVLFLWLWRSNDSVKDWLEGT